MIWCKVSPRPKSRSRPWSPCATRWSRPIRKSCGCRSEDLAMDENLIVDLTRQALWIALRMAAPLLGVALVVGVIIGLLQALTSVQEMTLNFVPKVGLMLAVFWVSMSFMTAMLTGFFTDQVLPGIAGS